MKITIERAYNGFIIRAPFEYECTPGTYSERTLVFSYEEEGDEVEALKDALWYMVNELEIHSSRYAKKRIDIRIIHGDKHECKESGCEICEEKE